MCRRREKKVVFEPGHRQNGPKLGTHRKCADRDLTNYAQVGIGGRDAPGCEDCSELGTGGASISKRWEE